MVLSMMSSLAVLAASCIFDPVSLDGDWEMAYLPYEWMPVKCPQFEGKVVRNAVPGYWEDMLGAFREAGIEDNFRRHPFYERQTLPVSGWADETTIPNLYGTFLYRRTVELSEDGEATLAFEGVRNQVHVWVNGVYAAFRAGFSTPFELKIKRGLLKKGRNTITLAVSNNMNLGYLGTPVVGLTTRDLFMGTGGVNGHLELRFARSAVSDVYVTTAKDLRSFTVHAAGGAKFAYRILDGERELTRGEASGDFTLPTAGMKFWSPENPQRYELVISAAGREFRQKFGLRRLVAKGEKLFLNDEPVYLRGVTEHCYFPKTVHLPRDLGYYRMITEKRKALGFNFVRFHTFVPPAEYFEATDELGMLVHVETPDFVTEAEFEAIVRFARVHPSVVIYCTGNETRIDRLVEVYLNYVADIVHRESDALFSPMSALRGFEYALSRKHDPTVDKPVRCNVERGARLAKFSDLWTSYQLGATSYESLDYATSADLDRWGDNYAGLPRLSHEICIDGSYPDLGLEKLYPKDSPILRAGVFSEIRKVLAARGILDRADTYFRNSCEWMWRIRKHCFEKLRAADRVAGFDFLGDINTHWHTFGYFVGMMDEFYRLKPGESVENVRRYNSAAVVLADLGNDFNLACGSRKKVSFSLSNYEASAPKAKLAVTLEEFGGREVFRRELEVGDVANGRLSALGSVEVPIPAGEGVARYYLNADFAGGRVRASNRWEIYAFPSVAEPKAAAGLRVVRDISREALLAAMERGESVVLLGHGPFKGRSTGFRIGLAGRCVGDYATVIEPNHPLLAGLPHDGYCSWQFRRLMHRGFNCQLEGDVPFAPIVDVASSEKNPIRQSPLFEFRVGGGRLLVCSYNLEHDDPAVRWLKAKLLAYAASPAFAPKDAISVAQLKGVLDAPRIDPGKNTNVARNPSDPSSDVRAGELALP